MLKIGKVDKFIKFHGLFFVDHPLRLS